MALQYIVTSQGCFYTQRGITVHCHVTRLFLQTLATMPPSLLCHFLSVPKGGIVSKFDCRRNGIFLLVTLELRNI